ncbi:MAG: PIN domain-containing protein [Reyranella sp.]|uniref:PIN domain-containing protein n=1 Tax=Reyranella sp. TaxID=1929291 RepID=UPI001AD22AF9|nr:PIN domain-containing protein [Reyranella sp.]MBN9087433.1 PIN domain-containing protein [Reyranella sp.]
MPRFVDTNILLYSISRDPAEREKCEKALELLKERDLALSAQVLQEFYWQSTRTARSPRIRHEAAVALIKAWGRFPVQAISVDLVSTALEIRGRYGLSYWDAAIIAAAQALGCNELLSEDMSHGQQIGSVRIVNPFRT